MRQCCCGFEDNSACGPGHTNRERKNTNQE